MTFKIKYKHGLQNDWTVNAENETEAKKLGLAHHRANTGFVTTVDMWDINDVIDRVEIVQA